MKSILSFRRKWPPFFEGAKIVRHHRYQIEYIERDHEVVCPRYTFADGTDVVVIPWFLIPGRPYPIQVYLHACGLYSSNPEMGQRGVAEATRIKFKLDTFSHSTVSRSFRSFEQAHKQSLENKYGEEVKASGAGSPKLVGAAAKACANPEEGAHPDKRFPAAGDTAARREEMAKFFPKFPCDTKTGSIEAISRQFVENWHKKSVVLLI